MEFIQSCFNLVALAGAAAHALANPTNAEPGLQNSRAADQLQAHLFITEEGVTLTEQYANSMGQHSKRQCACVLYTMLQASCELLLRSVFLRTLSITHEFIVRIASSL